MQQIRRNAKNVTQTKLHVEQYLFYQMLPYIFLNLLMTLFHLFQSQVIHTKLQNILYNMILL